MNLKEFDFHLPGELIAQYPLPERTASKLLVPGVDIDQYHDLHFSQLGTLLDSGDLLVINDTQVLPARMFASKSTGGAVEIMLERILDDISGVVMLRANRPIRPGQMLQVAGNNIIVECKRGAFFVLRLLEDRTLQSLFEEYGSVPLPPYIRRAADSIDKERYQTVYAKRPGAVAAPTAGLHFDQVLLDEIQLLGVNWVSVTLHIGAGTFKPVRQENILHHRMHQEYLEVNKSVCEVIESTRAAGGRVIAVGTTVVRALESAAISGQIRPLKGTTDLYITPGFKFQIVDSLITNFHLPKSTLLIMVSAFAGRRRILSAYEYAIKYGYRFFSYGDSMFLELSQ